MKKVMVLVAVDTGARDILFAEGCDWDGCSDHQLILPLSSLTENDKEAILNDSFYGFIHDDIKSGSELINFGEYSATLHCALNFERVSVKMVPVDISMSMMASFFDLNEVA